MVKGIHIRGFYATTILAGFINRFFALPEKLKQMELIDLSPATGAFLTQVGNVLFFIVVGIFAGWVIFKFLANIGVMRQEV